VPVGCFGTLTLFIAFVVSIAVIVFSAVKSTDVYKDALARAKAHPSVIEILGSPIKEGFLVSGNTNVNGASGEANLSIPISGPKGKGTIYVAAAKSLGRWNRADGKFLCSELHGNDQGEFAETELSRRSIR
jgi:hypothetical protein